MAEHALKVDPETADIAVEKRVWYRSTLCSAFVIGGVGFIAPGLWNAMSSLGAGGAQSPYLVNAANSLVFGLSMSSLVASWPLMALFYFIQNLHG